MLSDLHAIKSAIDSASAPEDVFGALAGADSAAQSQSLLEAWRRLVKVTHPDQYFGDTAAAALAVAAFVLLPAWREKAEAKIAARTYGDGRPHAMPTNPHAPEPVEVTVGKRRYRVSMPLFQGDIATLYACDYADSGTSHRGIFKVPRSAADNDLVESEHRAFTTLWPRDSKNEGDRRLLPRLADSFVMNGRSSARRVNIISRHDAYHSLLEISHAYPAGVDFRDAVWMFKRALAVLGFVHSLGLIHGAVLPSHLLMHPVHHGCKLVDWCYSVPTGERVRAIVASFKSLYPPEVLAKGPATAATDLYMLAKCIVLLLGGNAVNNQMPDTVPRQVQSFLHGCLLAAPSRRPSDAWQVHEEFRELIGRLIGPPAYRPFTMPARA